MSAIESSAQLLTNLFALSRDSVHQAHELGGNYLCREVTELNREVYHTVVTADHSMLGPLRVQLTCGMQKPPDTSDVRSVLPKATAADVLLPDSDIRFFMVAMRPHPIESMGSHIYINPTILVTCVQDVSVGAEVNISSFWEVSDIKTGGKVAGTLPELRLSPKGLFLPSDQETVDAFINFSANMPEDKWGSTGTLRRIDSRLRHMCLSPISQYDLYAGIPTRASYPGLPGEVADLSLSEIA
jgi:hypothetical protein